MQIIQFHCRSVIPTVVSGMLTEEALGLDSVEENISGKVCFHWETDVGFT